MATPSPHCRQLAWRGAAMLVAPLRARPQVVAQAIMRPHVVGNTEPTVAMGTSSFFF